MAIRLLEKSELGSKREVFVIFVIFYDFHDFSPNSFPAIGVLAGLVESLVLGRGCRANGRRPSDPPFLLLFT